MQNLGLGTILFFMYCIGDDGEKDMCQIGWGLNAPKERYFSHNKKWGEFPGWMKNTNPGWHRPMGWFYANRDKQKNKEYIP